MPAPVEHDPAWRRPVLIVGVAVAAFVGVAWAATSRPVPLAVEGAGGRFTRLPDIDPRRPLEDVGEDGQEQPLEQGSWGSDLAEVMSQVAVLLVVGTLVFLVARSVVRAVRLASEPRLDELPSAQAPPTSARELTDAVDDGLAVLAASGPVDDVIIACWVRLEEAAAAGGAGRRPSETPAELAVRVLAAFRVPDAAVQQLLELYRAARYSRHHLGEDDRARAIAALGDIRRSIEVGARGAAAG